MTQLTQKKTARLVTPEKNTRGWNWGGGRNSYRARNSENTTNVLDLI